MYRVLRLPTPMSVAAQNIVGITLTFKSGDPSFPTTLPGDTVLNNNGVNNYYKYNAFRPYVYYRTTGSTSSTPIFAIYDKFDRNIGTFKNLPNSSNGWTDRYIPLWAWSASGGTPSSLQYLYADVHIMCPTCIVGVEDINQNKSAVSAYPNPAGNELNILFKMPDVSNVSVSLINMVGQTVATQNIGKVSNGKAVFNTADLPAGMYIYTLNSNGVRSSGHIAIAH